MKLPDSLKSLGTAALQGCVNLKNLTIGNALESIESLNTFEFCDSLEKVVIGNNVSHIPEYEFVGCDSLTSVDIGNGVKTIGESILVGCTSLRILIPVMLWCPFAI